MTASSLPKVQAAAHLPPVISFSSLEEPEIILTASLINSSNPITIRKAGTSTWPFSRSVTIRNIRTGAERFKWFQNADVCRRRPPSPIKLTHAQDDRFTTMWPGEAIKTKSSFRPLGSETPEQAREFQPGNRYRALRFGMHALEIGEEYSIAIRSGLSIDDWMEGSKEYLLVEDGQADGEWLPRAEKIEVESADPAVFRVEA